MIGQRLSVTSAALGEFSEVGEIVEDFASDNATVVVGTVIDSDMGDELRVTVVATGLGAQDDKPKMAVVEQPQVQAALQRPAGDASGNVDYGTLDRPTVMRQQTVGNAAVAHSPDGGVQYKEDYLDVPAFLRRQAD